MSLNYNAPLEGQKSTIDVGNDSDQLRSFYFLRKALIEARKKQYFMPLASVTDMPKHMGKKIRAYVYVPMLDDRNINDQGIDAAGAVIKDGNLYGSSKDIGTITKKLPVLSENGGRVNRVGFSRRLMEGTISKFGFFYEFTQDSLDFDTDDQLKDHLATIAMDAASEITDDVLQMDLLTNAGVTMYAGSATKDAEVTGEGDFPSVLTYELLMRFSAVLTENRTPKNTKIITGSTYQDTRVLPASRIAYVGSELVPMLRGMKDLFNQPAFIAVQHYADAANLMPGEIGSIDSFRIIEVPEMQHWAGVGAEVKDNPGYQTTIEDGKEKYNVYPLLVVGDDSFSTIGFQTNGKSIKLNVITKMPGRDTADRTDPYGQTGFTSIQWWYGILVKRPERIGVIKMVAPI